MIVMHVCKLVLKVGHTTTPPKQVCERFQRVPMRHHDGGGLQNKIQRDMPLVLEALRAAVLGVMDKQPSGCGDPLGGRRRIIAQCYSVMLLMVPFVRRGPIMMRGG